MSTLQVKPMSQVAVSLPPEMIGRIFWYLEAPTLCSSYDWDNLTHMARLRDLVSLCSSCRAFRIVALAIPSLWTCLHLQKNQVMQKYDDILARMLDRSAGHHLSLAIDLATNIDPDDDEITDLLSKSRTQDISEISVSRCFQAVSSRINILYLRFAYEDIPLIEDVFREANSHCLRALEVNCITDVEAKHFPVPVIFMFRSSQPIDQVSQFNTGVPTHDHSPEASKNILNIHCLTLSNCVLIAGAPNSFAISRSLISFTVKNMFWIISMAGLHTNLLIDYYEGSFRRLETFHVSQLSHLAWYLFSPLLMNNGSSLRHFHAEAVSPFHLSFPLPTPKFETIEVMTLQDINPTELLEQITTMVKLRHLDIQSPRGDPRRIQALFDRMMSLPELTERIKYRRLAWSHTRVL